MEGGSCRPAFSKLLKLYFRGLIQLIFENTLPVFCCIIWRLCIIWSLLLCYTKLSTFCYWWMLTSWLSCWLSNTFFLGISCKFSEKLLRKARFNTFFCILSLPNSVIIKTTAQLLFSFNVAKHKKLSFFWISVDIILNYFHHLGWNFFENL